MAGSTVVRESN